MSGPIRAWATGHPGTFMSTSEKNLTEQKEKHLENRTHPSLNLCYFCLFHVQRTGTTSQVGRMLGAIYSRESRETALEKTASVVQPLRDMKLDKAGKTMEEGIGETMVYYSFSPEH